MTDSLGRETLFDPHAEGLRVRMRRVRVCAALALLLAAALLLLPLRYTAIASLSFDVASQPPTASVRGVAQVLGAREMAQDVFARLDPADRAALAGANRNFSLSRWLAADTPRAPADIGGATLVSGLAVTPRFGGRVLELSFTATRPMLAARVVQAYADAFLALDAEVRADPDGPAAAHAATPPMRTAAAAMAPVMPDVPAPLRLILLALATFALGFIVLRFGRPARLVIDDEESARLPVQLTDGRSVAWMDAGHGRGMSQDEALARLLQVLEELCARPADAGHLVVLTADTPFARSAACAVALARALSLGDARVALVALDGDAPELRGLVADPWAAGVDEMLFGVAGFGETIHRDLVSRAHIIPPGRGARGGAGVATADRLALILRALRQTYDCVIVAAPAAPHLVAASGLAALQPLLVCIEDMGAPVGSGVEAYAALAATGFNDVVMLRLADSDAPASAPALPALEADPVRPRREPAPRHLAPAA
ncbi:MAG: hypothetical protein B7Y12_17260 [Rhizobiales bacterium 24-66-13]|nr:MAG: hypothetical protein B7Y61_08390 [Rhizobiales bacterium 35-66-30]OYZ71370.1 MAG: hypothetical protein B7Y12_17260 [Rhizobiales bacterium 24-66-13]OZA99715.1 MAG: hypothetical protein B7X67_21190 [Rhizobiales bacterium 39-66-18]HQS09189.1 hypothetical protein [Xanthobacteraceae bacterium]HQS47955.1 hypothetical protein [Xanthobacteraceae bacterium]